LNITFWGAARTVTGSCHLVEHEGLRFLLDCGLFQGTKALKERNYADFPFAPSSIDFILLSHAHIDHCGLIPKLWKQGFTGKIYATGGTVDLCSALLPDCGHIQEMEVERKNRKGTRSGVPVIEPIYTADDGYAVMENFVTKNYNEEFSPVPGLKVTFKDSGHILGSSFVQIKYMEDNKEKTLVFTGDIGRYNHYIVNDPQPIECADTLIMESTYGNRLHKKEENSRLIFAEEVTRTIKAGGNVIIPAFAVDRTQDILMALNLMVEEGILQPKQIYVDSPLAVRATEIFCEHPECFDEETRALYEKKGQCPLFSDNIKYIKTAEESIALNTMKQPAIIISASGMADAGRIRHHLKHNLWRPECTVIFVGYQAEGTLGRSLLEGERIVKIHGEKIFVRAKIVNLDGYSAHGDYNEMLQWVRNFKETPQQVVLVHGEEQTCLQWAERIKENFGIEPVVPDIGQTFSLTEGRLLTPAKAAEAPSAEEKVFKLPVGMRVASPELLLGQIIRKASGMSSAQLQELLTFIEDM